MSDKEETQRMERSASGAILTGLAAGTANAVATQAVNALKKPKTDKDKK